MAAPDFRKIFELAPAPCLVLTPDLRIVAVSDAYLHATLTKREELLGHNLLEVYPDNPDNPQAVGNLRASLERAMKSGTPDAIAFQKRAVRPQPPGVGENEVRLWSAVNSPVFGEANEIVHIIHRVEDVTQSTEAVAAAKEAAEAATRELGSLSYSVSHDLRAPLRRIDGFSTALVEECGTGLGRQSQEYVDRIRQNIKQMTLLIDGLLGLSRVSGAAFVRQRVDLTALAHRVINEIKKEEPTRDVCFKVQEGLAAEGDARLLRMALENLIGNAWKFSSKCAAPSVEVAATKNNGAVVFAVRDNGVGFDMQHADKLFAAFQRLHSVKEFAGTGIGLATVRRIIHRHGGRVWADAHPGRGATFYFTLTDARPWNRIPLTGDV